ncbi:hypothetical protein EHQ10_14720 [Leptospira bouyouniensis]|uniref:Uncharacterized protein n=1 Tax=Leptospira bouyouniensis TaxID=2484911 RepID=A0ABY2KZZ2_9LEPT|nr:hypothetical protein EHQ10_14720 [Leptospira bouyouniensis]
MFRKHLLVLEHQFLLQIANQISPSSQFIYLSKRYFRLILPISFFRMIQSIDSIHQFHSINPI